MQRSIDRIYVEETVADHPRTSGILRRFPKAELVLCRRWGEVFNRRAQSFRLQKRRPALIVAEKFDRFVLEAPPGYGVGGERNFYFSHMLNCVYDCRYCFLQGMFRSAHLVVFVNFEDFEKAIRERVAATDSSVCFFSGYDCDSLALEPLTGFAASFVELFETLPARATLELRTKSVQVRTLLDRAPVDNVVVAFSLLPDAVGEALEPGVPSLQRRLRAITSLQRAGWRVGLRFDPLVHVDGMARVYREFFDAVFREVDVAALHSVSLGPFRLPVDFHRRMERRFPDEPVLVRGIEERDGMVSYRPEIGRPLLELCEAAVLERVPREIFFPCYSTGELWEGEAPSEPRACRAAT